LCKAIASLEYNSVSSAARSAISKSRKQNSPFQRNQQTPISMPFPSACGWYQQTKSTNATSFSKLLPI